MTPLHPKLVHFPVALIIAALLFIVLAIFLKKKRELFIQLTFWNLALGALSAIVAVITGLIAENNLVHNNAIHTIMETHQLLGIIVLSITTLLLIWLGFRIKKMKINEVYLFAAGLLIVASIVGYTAHLGGKMVYEEGAGIIPMEKMISNQPHEHAPGEEHEHATTEQHEHTNGEVHEHTTMEDHNSSDSTEQSTHEEDEHSHTEHSH
ncbi:MAG: DUF2231 domain-containing protein [Chlorobi bacterium]|nr:DUF2231 domain-containing protein [Chlorobiota bacterium]